MVRIFLNRNIPWHKDWNFHISLLQLKSHFSWETSLLLPGSSHSSHPFVRVWWINAWKGYLKLLTLLLWAYTSKSTLGLAYWANFTPCPEGLAGEMLVRPNHCSLRKYRGQRSNHTLISNSWDLWCKEQIQKQHCLCLTYFSLEVMLQKLEN